MLRCGWATRARRFFLRQGRSKGECEREAQQQRLGNLLAAQGALVKLVNGEQGFPDQLFPGDSHLRVVGTNEERSQGVARDSWGLLGERSRHGSESPDVEAVG